MKGLTRRRNWDIYHLALHVVLLDWLCMLSCVLVSTECLQGDASEGVNKEKKRRNQNSYRLVLHVVLLGWECMFSCVLVSTERLQGDTPASEAQGQPQPHLQWVLSPGPGHHKWEWPGEYLNSLVSNVAADSLIQVVWVRQLLCSLWPHDWTEMNTRQA